MSEDNYVRVLREHLQRFGTTSGLVHIEVRHADDCGIFNDKSCDCEPTVETGARVKRRYER